MTVLSATDLSPSALEASRLALEWGRRLHQPVTLVHVVDPTIAGDSNLRTDLSRRLERLAEAISTTGQVTPTIVAGARSEEIERMAREKGARLLVLGVHGRLDAPESCHQSVIARLLRSLPCPILLAPHEGPHLSWSEAPGGRLRIAVELEPATAGSVVSWLRGLRLQVPCDVTFLRLTGPAAPGLDRMLAPMISDLPGEGECTLQLRAGQRTPIDPLVWEGFVAHAHLLVLGVTGDGASVERILTAARQSTAPILCVPT
jgi:nucleotide-binding universal stress UspA family protein